MNRPDEYLSQLKWNDKLAVAVSFELSRSYAPMGNVEFNVQRDIYCFDHRNNIYGYPLKILIQMDFPFLNELNRFTQRVIESGLIEKWLSQYRLHGKEKFQMSYTIVQTEYFYVLFFIFTLMSIVAILTFIFERIVHQKVRTPNSSSHWRFIEMCIDPYRHFFLDTFEWID